MKTIIFIFCGMIFFSLTISRNVFASGTVSEEEWNTFMNKKEKIEEKSAEKSEEKSEEKKEKCENDEDKNAECLKK